jgi:hypothetical protein
MNRISNEYLGASDGRIHCWNAETGNRVCTLVSDSMSGQTIVSMNPKFMLLVSASNQLVSYSYCFISSNDSILF